MVLPSIFFVFLLFADTLAITLTPRYASFVSGAGISVIWNLNDSDPRPFCIGLRDINNQQILTVQVAPNLSSGVTTFPLVLQPGQYTVDAFPDSNQTQASTSVNVTVFQSESSWTSVPNHPPLQLTPNVVNSPPSGNRVGIIIGAVVGSTVLLTLIIVVTVCCWRRRQHRNFKVQRLLIGSMLEPSLLVRWPTPPPRRKPPSTRRPLIVPQTLPPYSSRPPTEV